MDKSEIAKKLDKWLDIINYWEDEIKEVAERYDSVYFMYEKYNKMIEDMYNLYKQLTKEVETN